MSFFSIDGRVGLDGLKHGELGASRKAHQPTEKDLAMRLKRRLGKSGQQALQQTVQRGYRCQTQGNLLVLRASVSDARFGELSNAKFTRNPLAFSRPIIAKVQVYFSEDKIFIGYSLSPPEGSGGHRWRVFPIKSLYNAD
jgi:hypothetical protein